MLRISPPKALSTLLLCLLTLPLPSSAATGQGSVSLWSDSGCGGGDTLAFTEPVVISLNKTLNADTCGDLPREAHSYRVDRRPTCANGTPARFEYYDDHNCQTTGYLSNAMGEGGGFTEYDGYCLALVQFASMAFICKGIGEGDTSSTTIVTSTDSFEPTSASSTESLPVNTPTTDLPVVSTFSATAPLYTYSSTSMGYSAVPTGTQPSSGVLPSGTGGSSPPLPSPSPFTGGVSNIKASMLSMIFAFGLGAAI